MSHLNPFPLALALSCLLAAPLEAQVPAELQSAMKARDEALAKADAATWDRLTSEDFTVVMADGRLLNKAQRLAEFRKEQPQPAAPLEQLKIRRYGNAFVRRFRTGDIWVMDVWAKDRQGWRVSAVQVTDAKQ